MMMIWKILSLIGEVAFTAWAFLLAFRVIGKRPGEDPAFDKYISQMSGTFKIMGGLGIIVIFFSLVDIVFLSR